MEKEEKKLLLRVGPFTNLNNLFLKEFTEGWTKPATYVMRWKGKNPFSRSKRKWWQYRARPKVIRPEPGSVLKFGWKADFFQPKWKFTGRKIISTFYTTREMLNVKDVHWKAIPGIYWERYNKQRNLTREEARNLYADLKEIPSRVGKVIWDTIEKGDAANAAYIQRQQEHRKNLSNALKLKLKQPLKKKKLNQITKKKLNDIQSKTKKNSQKIFKNT